MVSYWVYLDKFARFSIFIKSVHYRNEKVILIFRVCSSIDCKRSSFKMLLLYLRSCNFGIRMNWLVTHKGNFWYGFQLLLWCWISADMKNWLSKTMHTLNKILLRNFRLDAFSWFVRKVYIDFQWKTQFGY